MISQQAVLSLMLILILKVKEKVQLPLFVLLRIEASLSSLK